MAVYTFTVIDPGPRLLLVVVLDDDDDDDELCILTRDDDDDDAWRGERGIVYPARVARGARYSVPRACGEGSAA